MPVRLRDLLDMEGLALRSCTGEGGLDRLVSWAAASELADPTPWMNGGELLLTTGLRLRTAAAQTAFVARIAQAGGSGIGFGTGLSHTAVPRALLAAAREFGLPVLEVPYQTPFIALGRHVAERIAAERHTEQGRLVEAHDRLTQAVLAGDALEQLLRTLSREIGAPTAVLAADGGALAGSLPAAPEHRLQVEVDGVVVAWLLAGRSAQPEPLHYAARLVALELARRLSFIAGRRGLLGRLLGEVVNGTLDGGAADRLLAVHGVDPTRRHHVLLGQWADRRSGREQESRRRLSHLAWSMPQFSEGPEGQPAQPLSAVVEGYLLVLVPEHPEDGESQQAAEVHAKSLWEALRRDPVRGSTAAVGLSAPGAGARGVQQGYLEARAALSRGAGVHAGAQPRLADLLLSPLSPAVRQLSDRVLRPLLRFDAEHRADLIGTLRRFLATDGSVQATADQLFVHRNTVRYRLSQIEEFTGLSLASTTDRGELWLAVMALDRSRAE